LSEHLCFVTPPLYLHCSLITYFHFSLLWQSAAASPLLFSLASHFGCVVLSRCFGVLASVSLTRAHSISRLLSTHYSLLSPYHSPRHSIHAVLSAPGIHQRALHLACITLIICSSRASRSLLSSGSDERLVTGDAAGLDVGPVVPLLSLGWLSVGGVFGVVVCASKVPVFHLYVFGLGQCNAGGKGLLCVPHNHASLRMELSLPSQSRQQHCRRLVCA